MRARERFARLVRASAGRPVLALSIAVALALAGGAIAFGLQPDTSAGTLVSTSSATYQATADEQRHFGGDAVVILIQEPLPYLVETKELATVTQLEACLAGQVVVANPTLQSFTPAPPGTAPPYGGWSSPCGKLMRTKPVQVVYGPGTFLNQAVAAVNQEVQAIEAGARQAVASAQNAAYQVAIARGLSQSQATADANAAGQLEQQQQNEQLAAMYVQSGISGTPRIDDPQFIPQIVFDSTRGADQPKARFSYLFPTAGSALIQVRLKSSLSSSQQAAAISLIRQAVRMPMFASQYGGAYTVTGEPVVVADLASKLTGSIGGLLIAALVVMAATLLIVFRSRLRLLPLAIALTAVGITFGLAGLASKLTGSLAELVIAVLLLLAADLLFVFKRRLRQLGLLPWAIAAAAVGATFEMTLIVAPKLTMASLAVLPILIGLAVDYGIQFQSRVNEARLAGRSGAVARAAVAGAPTIATAALATAVGFLVLQLSPVPMVRGFGWLLVVGIAVALLIALTAGSAAIALGERSAEGVLAASWRGAADILSAAGRRVARLFGAVRPRFRGTGVRIALDRVLARSVAAPWLIIGLGCVLALIGWVADTQTSVQSDITKLVPAGMPALRDLRTLERVTGVSGEIDVTVRGRNVATPATISWMSAYQQKLLSHYRYSESQGCARATLCPAFSLPDLFSAGGGHAPALTAASVNSILGAVPPYFQQAVISADRREASIAFGIRLMPLARQQQVIDYMRSQLHPPPGVTAELAGLPVLAAQADGALSSSGRRLLTLVVGLILVGAVLFAVFRRAERAVVPLIPIALATGWSALIVFIIRIPLNPMSATLGALVIAISTEFSVLLSERFRQERAAGYELAAALHRTYRFTGTAVLASGITAIAGFGVLVLSDITMLRDFGFVTLIDLTVSLAGVLLVLPAVLALAERDDLLAGVQERVRRAGAALPRRRRAKVA